MSDERIFNMLGDDGTSKDFNVPEGCIYLVTDENDGIVLLAPRNSIELEAHIAFLPETIHRALRLGRESINLVFTKTHCQKLTFMIPEINSKAVRYAKGLGAMQEGINRKSFMKDGKLHDQILLGLTKEEYLCRH